MPSVFNGKQFFLTYSQSGDLSKEQLLTFLRTKGELKTYVIGSERHVEGGNHLHAVVTYEATVRGGARLFDCEAVHPNVQPCRSLAACRTYAKKDGDYIEELGTNVEQTSIQEDCLAAASETDWYQHCVGKNIPFAYAQFFWSRLRNDQCTINGDDHPGVMCEQLERFRFVESNAFQCFVVLGASGCGKTTWAKRNMPKPALFATHVDDLKKFRANFHKVAFLCLQFNNV